ncbi:MAG: DUF342 domain-containing protein [Cellulosilyticum sp.]|nr:DUF342 domain-containing protein [Cellulosilyticum sp.]
MFENHEIVRESVCVEVSRDGMLGIISFQAPQNGGEKIRLEEVKQAIKDKGITQGINEADLIEICQVHRYNYKYIIAQGQPPVEGKDGYIQFAFDEQSLKEFKPTEREDGTVDLRDLGAVKNVMKEDVLAVKIPAVLGQVGYNILGQVIKPQKVKEAKMPKGKNTRILEDQVTLVADIDGKLEYDDYKVNVYPVFVVEGDVDSSIGNIDFVGSVVINGSVHSGFFVKAGGSVEVSGSVEDAVIIAGEDIILSHGIQGTEKSKLIAQGNIITKFIQNANVEAGGKVVAEAILHSIVIAGESIYADIGKGLIVGGRVSATNKIVASNIGSPMGTVTVLQVGILPKIHHEYKQLELEMKKKLESLNKVDQSITFLISKGNGGQLNVQKHMMLERLQSTRQPLIDEYESFKIKHKKIGTLLREANEGMVKCKGIIYPGVKITHGHLTRYVDDKWTNVIVRRENDEIVF